MVMKKLLTVLKASPWVNSHAIIKEWQQDVSCVFPRDPAARHALEVLLTYPGVHAVMVHRLSHRLWQRNWHLAARLLSALARGISNVDIHPGAQIGQRLFIDHGAGVVIGETAEIGDDVTLYHGVTLGGVSMQKGKRHPTLGDGVFVGAGAKILGAIEIGDKVRVGANAVVVQNVPKHSTVVGIPGKILQQSIQDSICLDNVQIRISESVKTTSDLLKRIVDLECEMLSVKSKSSPVNTSLKRIVLPDLVYAPGLLSKHCEQFNQVESTEHSK